MSKPTVTSIAFDKSLYQPGDTITATVTYTSANEHGGDGTVGYSLSVGLTDELTGDTNSGETGQSADFYVANAPVAPNAVGLLASAALLSSAGLVVSSLGSGAVSPGGTSYSVPVTAAAGDVLVIWQYGSGVVSTSGISLSWTTAASGAIAVQYAVVPAGGVSGTLTVDVSAPAGAGWEVSLVTGADPGNPVVTSNTRTSSGNSVTFNAAAASSNLFMFAAGSNSASQSASESPAWSMLANPYWADGGYFSLGVQVSPNVTDLTASANPASYVSGCAGIELNSFVSAAGLPPANWTLVFNNLASDGTGTAVFEAVA